MTNSKSGKGQPRPTQTAAAPSGARRRRQALDAEIRLTFVGFLDACRQQIESDNMKSTLDEDLRAVARLLERKARRDAELAKTAGPRATGAPKE